MSAVLSRLCTYLENLSGWRCGCAAFVTGAVSALGFGHETERAARKMEPLETDILGELGVADPYASETAR